MELIWERAASSEEYKSAATHFRPMAPLQKHLDPITFLRSKDDRKCENS